MAEEDFDDDAATDTKVGSSIPYGDHDYGVTRSPGSWRADGSIPADPVDTPNCQVPRPVSPNEAVSRETDPLDRRSRRRS